MLVAQLIKKFSRGGPRLEDSDTLNDMIDNIIYSNLNILITEDTVLSQNYSGRTLIVNSTININLILKNNIKKGFQCNVLQLDVGTATPVAGVGVTINNRYGFSKTSGQYSLAGLLAYSNNNLVLFGDCQ